MGPPDFSPQRCVEETPPEVLHEDNGNYEVYYLPYRPNLRDRLYVKYREGRFNFLRKFLTMCELVLQPFFNFVIPYHNIGSFALNYVKQHPDVRKMIISGNPFNQFKFGYQLHGATGIKWIADYRDAWTTGEIQHINRNFLHRLIARLDVHFEKKWVGTASLVTASSKPIADSISALVNREAHALYNGFVSSDFEVVTNSAKYEVFTVTYVGTLYEGQKVEIFCQAFMNFIRQTPGTKARLLFPGISFYAAQHARIKNIMKGFEDYYECTERMDRNKILEIEKRSHLLLHVRACQDEHYVHYSQQNLRVSCQRHLYYRYPCRPGRHRGNSPKKRLRCMHNHGGGNYCLFKIGI